MKPRSGQTVAPTELAMWLRQQREARAWTRRELARQLIQAGHAAGDRHVPGMESMCHNIYRWERGADGVSERFRRHYCRVLGIGLSQFGPRAWPEAAGRPPATTPDGTGLTAAMGTKQTVPSAVPDRAGPGIAVCRGAEGPVSGESMAEQEVLMAAHDGSEHAERAERRDIGQVTMEQLRADVARLSIESMSGEPLPLFLEMRRVRTRIYRILDHRIWPRDQGDLYFLLGCLCDLMAVAAAGLGYRQAAEELIRSGWAYATVIDHRPLMAHLRLQLASILFWNGQPQQAGDLARDGLRYLPDGPNGAHLHVKYARAVARLGDADSARRAIAAATDARERQYTDDVLAIGGEFGLSLATQHYFAGSALTEISGAEHQAADELEQAASLYAAGPGPGEQHWFAGKALVGIDLAVIRLRAGGLGAAAAALEPVLSLPPAQRINALTTRLALVRSELQQPIYRRSAGAQELGEEIEEFGREAIASGLRGLPGAAALAEPAAVSPNTPGYAPRRPTPA
jgi:hypothetical protein